GQRLEWKLIGRHRRRPFGGCPAAILADAARRTDKTQPLDARMVGCQAHLHRVLELETQLLAAGDAERGERAVEDTVRVGPGCLCTERKSGGGGGKMQLVR